MAIQLSTWNTEKCEIKNISGLFFCRKYTIQARTFGGTFYTDAKQSASELENKSSNWNLPAPLKNMSTIPVTKVLVRILIVLQIIQL